MRAQIQATGASRGLALGRARLHLGRTFDIEERTVDADRIDDELQRLHAAMALAREQLGELRGRLQGALAHELGGFIDLHALLLDDPELGSGLAELIRVGHYAAEYALKLHTDRIGRAHV